MAAPGTHADKRSRPKIGRITTQNAQKNIASKPSVNPPCRFAQITPKTSIVNHIRRGLPAVR